MAYKIKILPIAELDIRENIEWYEEQKKGLGKLFYYAVKSRLDYIKKNPLHYQLQYRDTQNALIDKFPFLINYRLDEDSDKIIVFGVVRTSRSPDIWKRRR